MTGFDHTAIEHMTDAELAEHFDGPEIDLATFDNPFAGLTGADIEYNLGRSAGESIGDTLDALEVADMAMSGGHNVLAGALTAVESRLRTTGAMNEDVEFLFTVIGALSRTSEEADTTIADLTSKAEAARIKAREAYAEVDALVADNHALRAELRNAR